jgi:FixJ family two-component response regulator
MTDFLGIIAVVDDDDSVRGALWGLLRAAGYQAVTFASAEAFLASQTVATVDCLVADVNLPGMNGAALVAALVDAGTPLPAVLITARNDAHTLELIRRGGAVPHLIKPFSDEELFGAIHTARSAA